MIRKYPYKINFVIIHLSMLSEPLSWPSEYNFTFAAFLDTIKDRSMIQWIMLPNLALNISIERSSTSAEAPKFADGRQNINSVILSCCAPELL